MGKWKDERTWIAMFLSLFWGWSAIAIISIPLTWFHEGLHVLGAKLTGSTVSAATYFNAEGWLSTYIYPEVTKPLGTVTAQVAQGIPSIIYYFLPYVVLIPLGISLLLKAAFDDRYNILAIVGAPLLYTNYVAFFNDLTLYLNVKNAIYPPIFITKLIYFFCLAGIATLLFSWLRNSYLKEVIK